MKLNFKNYNIFMKVVAACSYNHDGIKKGLEEMSRVIPDNNYLCRPKSWEEQEFDDMWSVLTCLFGDYGTSPRGGWLDYEEETSKCIKMCIDSLFIDDDE